MSTSTFTLLTKALRCEAARLLRAKQTVRVSWSIRRGLFAVFFAIRDFFVITSTKQYANYGERRFGPDYDNPNMLAQPWDVLSGEKPKIRKEYYAELEAYLVKLAEFEKDEPARRAEAARKWRNLTERWAIERTALVEELAAGDVDPDPELAAGDAGE